LVSYLALFLVAPEEVFRTVDELVVRITRNSVGYFVGNIANNTGCTLCYVTSALNCALSSVFDTIRNRVTDLLSCALYGVANVSCSTLCHIAYVLSSVLSRVCSVTSYVLYFVLRVVEKSHTLSF